VLLYAEGRGTTEIARALGCVPATAARVVARFRERGEEALEDGRRDNGVPKVDDDALQALVEILAQTPEDMGWQRPTWTQELLAKALEQRTATTVSTTTIRRMLRHLGARWGCARPIVGCPWSSRRKRRRLREILDVVEHLGRSDVAFYEDEVDVHLNPKIGRDWMLRGHQRKVLTPGKNRKHYLAGALSIDGRELITVAAERKTGDLFLALLAELRRRHPDARRIHVILDNYKIHSSQRVQARLAELGSPFVLHFLPPYSPDDNRIERLWRELHANVTRNHSCRTMEDLLARVKWWLATEARRRRRLPPRAARPARRRKVA
jgi:transposase